MQMIQIKSVIFLNKQLKIILNLNTKKKGKDKMKFIFSYLNVFFFIDLEVVLFMMYLLKMIGVKSSQNSIQKSWLFKAKNQVYNVNVQKVVHGIINDVVKILLDNLIVSYLNYKHRFKINRQIYFLTVLSDPFLHVFSFSLYHCM